MPALAEFEPLRTESIDTIRARIDANVNAGLDPADLRWQDTVPGGFFYDHTQAFALELEGVYDYVSLELPASFFLPFSWGIYLDYWGDMLDVPRNPPAAASGMVTLTNSTNEAVLAAAGLEAAVPAVDLTTDPLVYTTQATVEVPALGEVQVLVRASDVGSEYNVVAGQVSQILSPGGAGLVVENEAGITGGADEELDEPYKARLLLEFTGTRGGGTIDDYVADTLKNFPEVGNVVVQAAWAGPNTVRLVISDHDNQPLAEDVITAVTAFWADEAPIPAVVSVATVARDEVAVVAHVLMEEGFTLDGASGTTPIREAIVLALADYFAGLAAGRNVLLNVVRSAILSVDGVYDVETLTLDGLADDVVIPDLGSAALAAAPTLTEALPVTT